MDFIYILNPGAILILLSALYIIHTRKTLPTPPGPRGALIAGVAPLLVGQQLWKTYARWSQIYGPIISFRIYNRRIIVINTRKAVHDLLDSRSGLYSDRPKSWMLHELCGRGNTVFNISATNERHRKYRKLLQGGLNARATHSYGSLLENQMSILLQDLRESPEQYQAHFRRNAAAIIMKVAYGYTVSERDDFFVRVAEDTSQISGLALAPGRWLVDYFPLLRFLPTWFPGAGFKQQAATWRTQLDALSGIPHEWVKTQMASGNANDCFTTRLLRPGDGMTIRADEEDIVKWSAGGLYAGAADTTFSALSSFVLLMACHQDVQQRARAEIDSLIGTERLPAVTDLSRLVYLSALYKEVMRFAPVAPLALPHQVIQEDEYEGYRIPRNATVIANVWSLMHDENEYPEPYIFDPNRFLPNELGEYPQPDPRAYAFGFGRRACPGSHFAEVSMLLIMSGILAKFHITTSSKEQSNSDILPPLEFTSGITSHVKPYDINILPRA